MGKYDSQQMIPDAYVSAACRHPHVTAKNNVNMTVLALMLRSIPARGTVLVLDAVCCYKYEFSL